ncbi:MAG: TonB-dependent receptor [Pseudomonadales bacterium]
MHPPVGSGGLVLAASLAGVAGIATADTTASMSAGAGNEIELVEVFAEKGTVYKARRSGDLRHAADLAATPQTISVLTQTQIRDSGKTDLKEILAAQAGITLGTGENGNAFGDRYIIRGHEARSDVFVDGVRDPGMTTRESFATEQIEITKGPSATFAGRGSTGGAVNGITKQASTDASFSIVEGAVGSDAYHRATLDTNLRVADALAVRLNLLHADEHVPNRDPASRERRGALLSGLYQATDKLAFVLDGYWLQANDTPDLGSYFDQAVRKPVRDIPVYLQDSDFLDTDVLTTTLKTTWIIDDALRLQNATRYGETENGYVTTGARGGTRGLTDADAPGAATITLSGHQGWQEVAYFVSQTNLFWNVRTWGLPHKVVAGVEYADENVTNGVYTLQNTAPANCVIVNARSGVEAPGYCATDGEGNAVMNLPTLLGRTVSKAGIDSDFRVDTVSAYLMDTVDIGEHWSVFLGLRYDRFHYRNAVTAQGVETRFDYRDGFWNGHLGVVYHINEDANVYATWSSSTNINGGESDVGGSCGYGGLCGDPDQVSAADPETTENLELGMKWSVFGDRLLATAALFRMTKDDVMESVGDAYSTLGTLNTGRNRVQGLELSLTGNLTEKLSAQVGAAFMDSDVLKAFNPDDVGRVLSNFADDSIYAQVRYEVRDNLAVGASWTYKSRMFGGQPDTAAGFNTTLGTYSVEVPSYHVTDAFVQWYPNRRVNLRLNVGNVFDREYWTAAYRSGSFMYLGDARTVRATVTVDLD